MSDCKRQQHTYSISTVLFCWKKKQWKNVLLLGSQEQNWKSVVITADSLGKGPVDSCDEARQI